MTETSPTEPRERQAPADRSSPSGRRCLVIGGGLIGAHVARELVRSGSEVTLLSRSVCRWFAEAPEAANARVVTREIEQFVPSSARSRELDGFVDAADVVFMLAGRSTPAMSDAHAVGSIVESIVPTLTVLESLRRTGTRRIVIATSGGTIYGRVRFVPTPETHPTDPISAHGVNSLAIESYANFFARAYGLIPTILRYSNVYGPGQQMRGAFGVIAGWLDAALTGSPAYLIGSPEVRRDFIYAEDVAKATVIASRIESGGTFNVGSGDATSLGDLFEKVQEICGRSLLVERLEGRSIDVPQTCLGTGRLGALTGWRPAIDLDAGLRTTWEWTVSNALSADATAHD